jgi:hypothetical protein
LYNGTAVPISSTTTLKAIAYESGMTDSSVSTATYTITGGGPGWYNTSWSNRKTVTINSADVSGSSSLTNFPMLFSVTDPNLATVANGGLVGNPDGSDILFTAADGVTKLNHEISLYSATNGQFVAWVQIPTLSPTANTVIYIYYGNAGVANQSNPSEVWDSNFTSVMHLGNGTTLSTADSTSNGNSGTNHGATATVGEIAGGAGFSGSTSYIQVPAGSYPGYPASGSTNTYTQTTELWFKTAAGGSILGQDDGTAVGSTPGGWVPALYLDTSGKLRASFFYHNTSVTQAQNVTSTSYNDNNWHHAVDVYNNGTDSLYVDGALIGSQVLGEFGYRSAYGYSLGAAYTTGWPTGSGWLYFNGSISELEISNSARSSDWIKTQYNNQSSPSTFVTLGTNQSAP